jgi:hypothetical protein
MSVFIRTLLRGLTAIAIAVPVAATGPGPVTLHGAVQFNDDHAFNKSLLKFEELVKKYYGKPINFVLHRNSELGLEKDYFAYMNQGVSVDYAIVSPAHMSTFSKAAPFIDAPFLFRDLAHWNKVLDADTLKPVADEIATKADVMLIGYAGGGTRNIFANKSAEEHGRAQGPEGARPGRADLEQDLRRDRHGADRHRLQRDLQRDPERRHQRRRERGRRRRGDEVLRGRPEPADDAARDHDPADRLLRQDLQEAAARPAGGDPQGRQGGRRLRPPGRGERGHRQARRAREGGKLKRIPFADRDAMKKAVDPVMADYAKEIGAEAIYAKINGM